jgi:ribosomal protein S3
MGQKVHPLGFRVGITKKHQSQWFARFNKHKYAQSVLEDRMLRQTLTNLFPQLLNPVLKKQNAQLKKDKNEESGLVPKITQIKIERGLIPYEIGIQIHAENCDLIKKSIENLKVNRDLLCNLQKTRRYLQHLQLKLNDLSTTEIQNKVSSTLEQDNTKSLSLKGKKEVEGKQMQRSFKSGRFRTRLTRQQLRRQRLVLKRLRKRQAIRRRYKQLIYKGLFLTKKGNKVIQKFPSVKGGVRNYTSTKTLKKDSKQLRFNRTVEMNNNSNKTANVFKSRVKRKFVSIFINRMNNKFLQVLKNTFISLSENVSSQTTSNTGDKLGWNKKWNFANVQKQLAVKPLSQLTKLSTVLERKSLKKMESLRKNYIASGLISKTDALNYYQMLNFLKQLKELISQIKRKQKFQFILSKLNTNTNTNSLTKQANFSDNTVTDLSVHSLAQRLQKKTNVTSITLNVLSKKLNNIENECRKVQFIEYLKQTIKKHRTDNIYLYLSTIADARKDLRKLQQFTKRNASFLFGGSFDNLSANANANQLAFERVSNVCKQSTSFAPLSTLNTNEQTNTIDKSLSEVFLDLIEKQRNMYKDNAQLTPKIAIKFYSVNPNTLKAKSSVIADSVVEALEKRKAFRKVIKDAKENLMRTPGVKGVKIQLSGRLNGAEIARSEWVRAGRVPLQTLRANLDYSYKTANTIYGIIGIKVWIFKGYTKLI